MSLMFCNDDLSQHDIFYMKNNFKMSTSVSQQTAKNRLVIKIKLQKKPLIAFSFQNKY